MANANKNHIPVTNSKTKEVRWMEVDTSVTCATRPTVTAAIWATLSTTQPETKAGYTFKKKLTCDGGAVEVDTEVVFDNSGTTDPDPDPVANADQLIITGVYSA